MKIDLTVILALSIVGTILAYVAISSETVYAEKQNMSSMAEMCRSMMNKAPKDVVIKTTSSQIAKVGTESNISVLVLDKKTSKPLDNADVALHIEKGGPMDMMKNGDITDMMSMMENMSEAENIGAGKYMVKFTPAAKGYYTMHTHVIPADKSMMSMMNNHMDIGIIAK